MSEQASINPWNALYGDWFELATSNNFCNPECHDDEAEKKARLDFSHKAEAKIKELLPEDVTKLSQRFAKLRSENQETALDVLTRNSWNANWDGPGEFYEETLSAYKGKTEGVDSSDDPEFGLFVEEFHRVVYSVIGAVAKLPDDFFNIHHKSRGLLLDHIFEACVSMVVERLRQEALQPLPVG